MNNNENQYKFTEGEKHLFTITGFTEIPGTGESFYILKNPFGGKHLLKANHYQHYQLKTGQTIKCKIDKINCSGKIFLEPENPRYKEGEVYVFELVKIIDHLNSVGQKEKAAIVRDDFRIETICSLPESYPIDLKTKKIKCQVLRIKKAQLFLAVPEIKKRIKQPQIGERHWFTVVDIKPLEDHVDYYILQDEYNNLYSLKKEMYQHYGFSMGEKVECIITKFDADSHLKIEPVHPYYKIGKTYWFSYLRTERETTPLGKEESVIIVKDIYGIETKVRSGGAEDNAKDHPETIECVVEGIRKGKAILALKAID
ncbi:MAG: hypothetical protein V2I54_04095 [Bacteroidales bacterium]|jgi:hypothetical protein|nr:hypothetical protein [Bacteroidales bacterium]